MNKVTDNVRYIEKLLDKKGTLDKNEGDNPKIHLFNFVNATVRVQLNTELGFVTFTIREKGVENRVVTLDAEELSFILLSMERLKDLFK